MTSPAARLLAPRSIVVVGASDRSRWSQGAVDNLRGGGFAGPVHLVNPRGGIVHGRAAATSCAGLSDTADLGIILVPGHATVSAIEDLAACGARSAVILTSGFAELGADGKAAQDAVSTAARAHGIRLLGPNSLGFLNFVAPALVWTTPIQRPSRLDGVAIISQSGATAFFLTNLAAQWDVGLSYVVATGNEADLGSTDFARALVDDPATRAIALFIETVRDPAGFLAVATAARAAGKPVIVLKTGKSEVSAKAALAHTGALVGDDRVFDAVCRQYGIIRTRSIEELLATADIAARTGRLRPGGLAVISNSGGICEIAADSAEACGIALPPLSDAAAQAVQQTIPGFATAHNPLDLTGGITPEQCGAVVDIMAAQPSFAALLCPYYEVPTREADQSERLTALHDALARGLRSADIPGFVVSYTATHLSALSRRLVAENAMPYLACGLDRAITALGHVAAWSAALDRLVPPLHKSHAPELARPRSEHDALALLARHGVPTVPSVLVTTAEAAIAAAGSIDGPVVLKIASPDIGHKSDIGGVALRVSGDTAVREAFERVRAAGLSVSGASIEGVLVAPMRPPGLELFVGVSQDPQWGAVLAVGLGGIFVEVLQDVSLRLLPVGGDEVRLMLAGLRGAALLAGSRGKKAADLDAIARAVAAIGDAALACGPALAALDVNPLWVDGSHVEALDALFIWNEEALSCAPI